MREKYNGKKEQKIVKIDEGLVQPIANWAKRRETSPEEWDTVSEVRGKRFTPLLGQCGVKAPGQ